MIQLPTKPHIIPEVKRDEYTITFILRTRHSWKRMKPEDRRATLLAGADQLEAYAQQMRDEADPT